MLCRLIAAFQPNSHTRSSGLAFNGLHPVNHVITWITTHLPTLMGWQAELAWRGWLTHSGQPTHEEVTCQP